MNFLKKGGSFFLILLFLFAFSCEKVKSPVPINYGVDKCEYCAMKIMDDRFGAELITETGKVYKFDSTECLAAYYIENKDKLKIHSIWVTDFYNREFINAETAYYLHSPDLPSPMGMNLSAFKNMEDLNKIKEKYNGKVLKWSDILNMVKNKWLNKRHNHHHMHM
ncbi:nitrous oxide reductase accessory protein NosL [Persephonella sp.]